MTVQMDILGTSPLIVRRDDEERIKRSIEVNFETALKDAIEQKGAIQDIKFYVQIETPMDQSDRIERRMGLRKFNDWKLILTLVYDEEKISKDRLVDIMHLAAQLSSKDNQEKN